MFDWKHMANAISEGEIRSLARAISLVENQVAGYDILLSAISQSKAPVIGITGPPGAGKSTLVNALVEELLKNDKRVGILCIDPSSPFNQGALLGDRIRMRDLFTNNQVYIRSLATRGSVGGLNPHIIEITDLMRAFPFDYILVETVGVGQSEIEIAGLADRTIVALVPEAGDEIQTMKAGLMEIADLFVVNKADRPEADLFVRNLNQMLAPVFARSRELIPVIKTVAHQHEGISELLAAIETSLKADNSNEKKEWLLTEKAYQLISAGRMKDINKETLRKQIRESMNEGEFNLYAFIRNKTN